MKRNKQAARFGSMAILAALLLRFACGSALGGLLGCVTQPDQAALLIYAETGRKPVLPGNTPNTTPPTTKPPVTDPSQPTDPPATTPTDPPEVTQPTDPPTKPTNPPESTQPSQPVTPPAPIDPIFSAADTQHFSIDYECSYRPDAQSLLLQKVSWNLTGSKPTVLIVHSHGTEAYTRTPDTYYDGHAAYRTTDDRYNMISLGDELTRLLEEEGIHVIHDRTAFDYLDYDNAYNKSRKAIQEHLKQNPSIKLVLDLHRDAMTNADGSQYATSATVNGKASAQLMFVVGTDAYGENNPNWKTNLSVAEKLSVLMDKAQDGVCRPIKLRGKRYNQDLGSAALIVEVGTAGNTHAQAMNAIPALADAITALAKGSK